MFGVSRQIIVGDIALLRASGTDITATPRGYVLTRGAEGIIHRIPCRHRPEEMKEELQILVDNGCLIRDVIVEHPIYGQLVGQLDIATRYDVDEFIAKVSQSDAAPLSDLTGGIHLHTIFCPDEEVYRRVLDKLRKSGFLFEQ
jgi:transcriptional regulator of NAD metabolism